MGAVAGRLAEAEGVYRKLLALWPGMAEVHNDLGNVLCAEGKLDEAQIEFERALALKPNLCAAYSNLGNIHSGKGQFDQAVARYRQARRWSPTLPKRTTTWPTFARPRASSTRRPRAIAGPWPPTPATSRRT